MAKAKDKTSPSEIEIRDQLIAAMLVHVPFDGWGDACFAGQVQKTQA